ncbi:unnamed protein product [Clonostachys rosea f. rosea IK726]|uniref:Uncharacterized protein n=1 Tax=Clonostachys rosea f. rosea IK726 TaxID=1349383 RepID=A0ACA9U557_BIOOC|nr:unnamed protein product [Clonostachys rosea f. rosea IK726]
MNDYHIPIFFLIFLWLHQALRIDGRYYELTRMLFFADSTKPSDSAVEDDESYAKVKTMQTGMQHLGELYYLNDVLDRYT